MLRRLFHVDVSLLGLLVVAGVLFALWLVVLLRPLVLLLVIAAMFATAVSPAVEWMAKRGLPRAVAVLLLLLVLVLALGLFALLVGPVIVRQGQALADKLPELRSSVVKFLEEHASHDAAQKAQSFSPGELKGGASIAPLLSAGRLVLGGITALVTVIVVAAYMAFDAPRILQFVDFATPARWHPHIHRIFSRLRTVVGGYIRGQVVTSVLAMIVGFVLFTVLRVPNAVALAVLGGLADVVPIIGIYLWVIPSALAALGVSTAAAIIVVVVLVVYQELESRVLVQRIYGRTLHLPSIVVVIALLVGAELQGIVGALLALPAAAAIRVLVEYGDEMRKQRQQAHAVAGNGAAPDVDAAPRVTPPAGRPAVPRSTRPG